MITSNLLYLCSFGYCSTKMQTSTKVGVICNKLIDCSRILCEWSRQSAFFRTWDVFWRDQSPCFTSCAVLGSVLVVCILFQWILHLKNPHNYIFRTDSELHNVIVWWHQWINAASVSIFFAFGIDNKDILKNVLRLWCWAGLKINCSLPVIPWIRLQQQFLT